MTISFSFLSKRYNSPGWALKQILVFFLTLVISSCSSGDNNKLSKAETLHKDYCASCHLAPDPSVLSKQMWAEQVLPDMAARLGLQVNGYSPLKGMPFKEQEAILNSGIYPSSSLISPEDWKLLSDYILEKAPDSVDQGPARKSEELIQFTNEKIDLREGPGTMFSFLAVKEGGLVQLGNLMGKLSTYNFENDSLSANGQYASAITDRSEGPEGALTTLVGKLDPSETRSGSLSFWNGESETTIQSQLHRPVHSLWHDLNGNGQKEIVTSEFGHLTGELSLIQLDENGEWSKNTLLGQPGTIRTLNRDMNQDGLMDLVCMTSQGDESITVLLQRESLEFSVEKLLRFDPIYGTSWFDLVDVNNDGLTDIVTVHGDNADKTYFPKPYHGLRIHINKGNLKFEEAYFYPMYGATRFVSHDFDQDGDLDFGVISTFPDYEHYPNYSFVYLENEGQENLSFRPYTTNEASSSRWFLLDKGDVDGDGDMDIVLSAFTYVFTPVPESFTKKWEEEQVDLMVLKNTLISD